MNANLTLVYCTFLFFSVFYFNFIFYSTLFFFHLLYLTLFSSLYVSSLCDLVRISEDSHPSFENTVALGFRDIRYLPLGHSSFLFSVYSTITLYFTLLHSCSPCYTSPSLLHSAFVHFAILSEVEVAALVAGAAMEERLYVRSTEQPTELCSCHHKWKELHHVVRMPQNVKHATKKKSGVPKTDVPVTKTDRWIFFNFVLQGHENEAWTLVDDIYLEV